MTRWRSDREVAEWAGQCLQFDEDDGRDEMARRVLVRVLEAEPVPTSESPGRAPVTVELQVDVRPGHTRRRLGVLAAAAAVLVVVVLAVVGRADEGPVIPTELGGLAPGWELVGDPEGTLSPADGDGRLTLSSVAAHAGGFVAVGTELRGDAELPVVATSADGRSWHRIDRDLLPGGAGTRYSLVDVAGSPDGMLVAGMRRDAGSSAPVVWSTTDLQRWDELALPVAASATVSAIAVGGGSAVIVGRVAGEEAGDGVAAAWVSMGGAPWNLVRLPASGGTSVVIDVAWTDHGFIAVGAVDDRAAVWSLADDGTWTLAAALGGPGSALTSVVAHGATVIAAGRATTERVDDLLVQSSADGVHWRSSDLPPTGMPRFPGPLVVGKDGVVLLGAAMVGREVVNIELRSEDGRVWTEREVDLPGSRQAAAMGPSALVAVGIAGSSPALPATDPAAGSASIWIAPFAS